MEEKNNRKKQSMKSLDVLFGTGSSSDIQEINLDSMHPFPKHPFKVEDDHKMAELVESIRERGVVEPGIVRMRRNGGYEIISGHRRWRASILAGCNTMPVLIKNLTDDEAIIIMVDSNNQREVITHSERSRAYKMKFEAMKRQGKRNDLTSPQVGARSDGKRVSEIMAEQYGTSKNQIERYIKLADLSDTLMEMTDSKRIPFNTAVELAYLTSEQQEVVQSFIESDEKIPSLEQAKQMKSMAKNGIFTEDEVEKIFSSEKKDDIHVKLNSKILYQYFPRGYTPKQMQDIILDLLRNWSDTAN